MVLVSNRHDFIFLKTRKTAGTSVEMLLEPLCTRLGHVPVEKTQMLASRHGIVGARLTRKPPGRLMIWRYGRWGSHMHASKVLKALGERRFDAMTKIATIRNPFTRIVSSFDYRSRLKFPADEDFSSARARFRAFVLKARWRDDRPIVFVGDRYVIDEAIRYESLAEDLAALARKLSLPIDPAALPATKIARPRKHAVAEYFDPDTIDVVRKRLSWVFDRYDYPDHPSQA